LATYSGGGHGS